MTAKARLSWIAASLVCLATALNLTLTEIRTNHSLAMCNGPDTSTYPDRPFIVFDAAFWSVFSAIEPGQTQSNCKDNTPNGYETGFYQRDGVPRTLAATLGLVVPAVLIAAAIALLTSALSSRWRLAVGGVFIGHGLLIGFAKLQELYLRSQWERSEGSPFAPSDPPEFFDPFELLGFTFKVVWLFLFVLGLWLQRDGRRSLLIERPHARPGAHVILAAAIIVGFLIVPILVWQRVHLARFGI